MVDDEIRRRARRMGRQPPPRIPELRPAPDPGPSATELETMGWFSALFLSKAKRETRTRMRYVNWAPQATSSSRALCAQFRRWAIVNRIPTNNPSRPGWIMWSERTAGYHALHQPITDPDRDPGPPKILGPKFDATYIPLEPFDDETHVGLMRYDPNSTSGKGLPAMQPGGGYNRSSVWLTHDRLKTAVAQWVAAYPNAPWR